MRFLLDDLVRDAALSTDKPNGNYPVVNLQHPFLHKRYQADDTTATATVTFAAVSSADCFFYAFHNCTAITLRLYSAGPALEKTVVIASPESGAGSEYFTVEAGLIKAEIDITAGSAPVYLGGVGLGLREQLPRPLADFEENTIDQSVVTVSPTGQALQLRVDPRSQETFRVSWATRAERDAAVAAFNAIGVGAPMWADVFYGDHTFRKPFYGRLIRTVDTRKIGADGYDFTLSLEEAR